MRTDSVKKKRIAFAALVCVGILVFVGYQMTRPDPREEFIKDGFNRDFGGPG